MNTFRHAVMALLTMLAMSAQAQLPPRSMPPEMRMCMSYMGMLEQYGIMRVAGVTREDAEVVFRSTILIAEYMSEQTGVPISPDSVSRLSQTVDLVYGLDIAILEDPKTRKSWERNELGVCVSNMTDDIPVPRGQPQVIEKPSA